MKTFLLTVIMAEFMGCKSMARRELQGADVYQPQGLSIMAVNMLKKLGNTLPPAYNQQLMEIIRAKGFDRALVGVIERMEMPVKFKIVKEMVDTGAHVNVVYDLDTPLSAAVKKDNLDVAKYLIEAGADIHRDGLFSQGLLDVCRSSGMVRVLVRAGARIDGESMIDVAGNGTVNVLQEVINLGGRKYINYENTQGMTPLIVAVRRRDADKIKLILDAGASINHVNTNGKTALDEANYGIKFTEDNRHSFTFHEQRLQSWNKVIELLQSSNAKTAKQLETTDIH